jgi:hypothetical protein
VTTIEAARKARDEAREALAQKITEISNYFTEISNYRTVGGPCPIETEQLDAYEVAVKNLTLAELVVEQSPELAESEAQLRANPCYPMEIDLDIIVAELDRLRALIAGKKASKP